MGRIAKQYLFCRKLLRGAAQFAVHSADDCTCWENLKEFLINEFQDKLSAIDVHKILTNTTFLEFYNRIKAIAKPIKMDLKSIIQYIALLVFNLMIQPLITQFNMVLTPKSNLKNN